MACCLPVFVCIFACMLSDTDVLVLFIRNKRWVLLAIETNLLCIVEYSVKLHVVSVLKQGFWDHLLGSAEDSHKINGVCCFLRHEMFSFTMICHTQFTIQLYIKCSLDMFNFICTASNHYDCIHACSSKVTRHQNVNLVVCNLPLVCSVHIASLCCRICH